ncbi:hypothetical protein SAVIM338S_00922 [Streptomyces avidinii]
MAPAGGTPPPTRTALLFPGQGSQRPGMGAPWLGSRAWDQVDLVSEASGEDVAALLLSADATTLSRTDRAQLAIFTLEMMILCELPQALRQSATACAGHSLGEFAALVAADVLAVPDAARLVAARGRAMQAACQSRPGSMCAVLGDRTAAEALVEAARQDGLTVWVANLNGPRQTIVAGPAPDLADLMARAVAQGLGTLMLPVSGAFHTPLMAGAAPALHAAFTATNRRPGRIPVVANIDARPHTGHAAWPDMAARHLTQPVLWSSCLETLAGELGCDLMVEIGPGTALTTLARQLRTRPRTAHIATPHDLTALASLTGS